MKYASILFKKIMNLPRPHRHQDYYFGFIFYNLEQWQKEISYSYKELPDSNKDILAILSQLIYWPILQNINSFKLQKAYMQNLIQPLVENRERLKIVITVEKLIEWWFYLDDTDEFSERMKTMKTPKYQEGALTALRQSLMQATCFGMQRAIKIYEDMYTVYGKNLNASQKMTAFKLIAENS